MYIGIPIRLHVGIPSSMGNIASHSRGTSRHEQKSSFTVRCIRSQDPTAPVVASGHANTVQ